MTAICLKQIVTLSLAEVGIVATDIAAPRERSRATRWLPHAHGIGIRSYPSGRSVYVAQARIGWPPAHDYDWLGGRIKRGAGD